MCWNFSFKWSLYKYWYTTGLVFTFMGGDIIYKSMTQSITVGSSTSKLNPSLLMLLLSLIGIYKCFPNNLGMIKLHLLQYIFMICLHCKWSMIILLLLTEWDILIFFILPYNIGGLMVVSLQFTLKASLIHLMI